MTTLVAPVFPKPRPRECAAGTTPCGQPARLYPCGWRCDVHRPGAPRHSESEEINK